MSAETRTRDPLTGFVVGPWIVETVRYGWIVVGCACSCDNATGEWWTVCAEHGAS